MQVGTRELAPDNATEVQGEGAETKIALPVDSVKMKNNSRAGKGGEMTHESLLFREAGIRNSCLRHLNSLCETDKRERKEQGRAGLSRRSPMVLISRTGHQPLINQITL